MCGSPNLQYDGIWSWDFGEANRVTLAPVGGALMMRSLSNEKERSLHVHTMTKGQVRAQLEAGHL